MLQQAEEFENPATFRTVIFGVLAIHSLFFFSAYLWEIKSTPPPLLHQKVTVQTVALSPAKEGSKAEVIASSAEMIEIVPQETLQQEEPIVEPAKPIKKPLPKAKAKPEKKLEKPAAKQTKANAVAEAKKEVPAKDNEKAKQQALLAKAKESIGKIAKKQDNGGQVSKQLTAKLDTSYKKINGLATETIVGTSGELSSTEVSYVDMLVARLQSMLKLPEYGEVTISLTLHRTGKVEKLSILQSASRRNREYVEKELPNIVFPGFDKLFTKENSYTFILTLSNE